jgi:hypothetical protein
VEVNLGMIREEPSKRLLIRRSDSVTFGVAREAFVNDDGTSLQNCVRTKLASSIRLSQMGFQSARLRSFVQG